MKSGDFPPRWCVVAVIRQKLRGTNTQTQKHTRVYTLHKHIYRCTLSPHQTHNSLVLCAMGEIVFHFTECLTLFARVGHFVTQCSVSA